MNTILITTSQNIELEYDLASLGERIVAYILDMLIILAYVLIATFLWSYPLNFVKNDIFYSIIVMIPIAFYDLLSEVFMNGQSVGKRVMKMKVISIDGHQPTLGQYIIRWLFRLVDISISFGMCGLISVAVSERKQRLGDMVAGTALIRTLPRADFHQTLYVPTEETSYTVTFPSVITLTDKDIQLVKEATVQILRTGNQYLGFHIAEKVKKILGVETSLEPLPFLKVVIADYNYLTSKG